MFLYLISDSPKSRGKGKGKSTVAQVVKEAAPITGQAGVVAVINHGFEAKKKSYAPKGETINGDANNLTLWDGFLGGNFSLRLHRYLNTNKHYLGLRRNGNVGSNMAIEYFWSLMTAMEDMALDHPDIVGPRPPREDLNDPNALVAPQPAPI